MRLLPKFRFGGRKLEEWENVQFRIQNEECRMKNIQFPISNDSNWGLRGFCSKTHKIRRDNPGGNGSNQE